MNKNADKHLTTFPYENYYCMTQCIYIHISMYNVYSIYV